MFATPALLVVCALAGGNDVVLLDFTATWCGPCQAMSPVVARLQSEGYPVRKVDVDAEKALAQRFGIREIPCFVLVAGGREVERIKGPASYERLAQVMSRAAVGPSPPATQIVATAPSGQMQPVQETGLHAPRAAAGPQNFAGAGGTAVERAMAATVRLKIEDP